MIFNFEKNDLKDLDFMPMVIRMNFDILGIKLKLSEWQSFSYKEKEFLINKPINSEKDKDSYIKSLLSFLKERELSIQYIKLNKERILSWESEDFCPDIVLNKISIYSINDFLLKWKKISPLQRFILIKLAESKRGDKKLKMALEEFSLI